MQSGSGVQELLSKDRRFATPAWEQNALAGWVAASYLVNARCLMHMAEAVEGDEKSKSRIRFAVEQWIAASAPSNFLTLNAEAQHKAIESSGKSIAQGIQNLLHDMQQGHVSMTDESQFEVGRNVATTEGAVVFENELFQLLEYKPLGAKVFEKPLLSKKNCTLVFPFSRQACKPVILPRQLLLTILMFISSMLISSIFSQLAGRPLPGTVVPTVTEALAVGASEGTATGGAAGMAIGCSGWEAGYPLEGMTCGGMACGDPACEGMAWGAGGSPVLTRVWLAAAAPLSTLTPAAPPCTCVFVPDWALVLVSTSTPCPPCTRTFVWLSAAERVSTVTLCAKAECDDTTMPNEDASTRNKACFIRIIEPPPGLVKPASF